MQNGHFKKAKTFKHKVKSSPKYNYNEIFCSRTPPQIFDKLFYNEMRTYEIMCT